MEKSSNTPEHSPLVKTIKFLGHIAVSAFNMILEPISNPPQRVNGSDRNKH